MTEEVIAAIAANAVNDANRLYDLRTKPICPRCGEKEFTFKVYVGIGSRKSEYGGCKCGWGMLWDLYADAEMSRHVLPWELEEAAQYSFSEEIVNACIENNKSGYISS